MFEIISRGFKNYWVDWEIVSVVFYFNDIPM